MEQVEKSSTINTFLKSDNGIASEHILLFADKQFSVKCARDAGILLIDSTVTNNGAGTWWKHYNDESFVEFNFLLEGNLTQTHSGLYKNRRQHAGCFNLLFNPDSWEQNSLDKHGAFRNLGIHLSTQRALGLLEGAVPQLSYLAKKIERREPFVLEASGGFSPEMRYLFNTLWKHPAATGLSRLHFEAYQLELFVLASARFASPDTAGASTLSRQDKDKLHHAREILTAQLHNPPSLHELSLETGLNEFKLKKGFKALFGAPVMAFVHEERMTRARIAIFSGEKTISEIAYELGYAHPQHFHRAFKKHFGQTPKSLLK